MYLNFFGLKENPFSLSPDPRFLYYSSTHKEALSRMLYSIRQKTGFMLLTGDVGTGKTSLVNALVRNLPKSFQVVVLAHSILSTKGLLQSICRGFGIAFRDLSPDEMLFKLQDFLRWKNNVGTMPVLIIDEAQILATNILEHIRLLSNFENMNEKLIQILLVGQPEIKSKLSEENLLPLAERIYLHYDLQHLTPVETKNYVYHRLSVAGYPNGNHLFSDKAIHLIHSYSEGIPRRINIFSDKALLVGYAKNRKFIG